MKSAPIPANDAERIAELESYEVLDTPPEVGFDDITELASFITGKPIALVSLVDGDRQWFKSKVGLGADETPRDISFCGHAIGGDEIFIIEDALHHPDFSDNPLTTGAPHVVFYAGVPLQSPAGFHLGTLCVIDDHAGQITDEQKVALRRLARQVVAQLELRKRARSLEQTSAELRLANQRLNDADAAKSRFISSLSHEIRTPLNAIEGALQVIEEVQLPADEQELVEMAHGASGTVLQLVNDVLDLSKVEAGRMELSPSAQDVVPFTQRVAGIFRSRAQKQGVELVVSAPAAEEELRVFDELRVKQVLMNLIGNAIKFTPPGGEVRVELKLEAEEGTWRIADSGIGMAQATLAKLGRPFEQADHNVQVRYGGTGLGISIAKSIVELAGGSLDFASEMGKGTVSTVRLPLPRSERVVSHGVKAQEQSIQPKPTLIVDDVLTNRAVLRKMLTNMGFAPEQAANGLDALTIFRREQPDVVLLDIQMPDMDGYEVLRNIREFEAKEDSEHRAFVVAVTGQAYDDDVRRALRAGFDAHLAKPVKKGDLKELLGSLQ